MSIAEFFAEYGMFVLQFLTAIALLAVIIGTIAIVSRRAAEQPGVMTVEKLNEKFEKMRDAVNAVILDKKSLKEWRKEDKQKKKQEEKSVEQARERMFVIDFKGDIHASANVSLREEIGAIISVAKSGEVVLLRLENPGGAVHEHGLAASQLLRLKAHGLRLIVAVDKVAASGGYLMACVADQILAAPFAIVGSIGVLVQLPNLNRWLESKGIDYEQVTAGRYKRTLTVFGKNTEEDRDKVREELEDVHDLFKSQIAEHRPQVDIETVATGEHWYGTQALELKLIDELQTSDEYIAERIVAADVYRFEFKRKKTVPEKVRATAQALLSLAQ